VYHTCPQVVNKGNNAAALFKYDNSIYVGSEPTLTKAPLDVYYSVCANYLGTHHRSWRIRCNLESVHFGPDVSTVAASPK
jgi:hypothetical protein